MMFSTATVFAQTEYEDEDTVVVKKDTVKQPTFTYYRIGLDISKFVASSVQKNYQVLEAQADVYYKKNLFCALEFGYGTSLVKNKFLDYKSNNSFLRLGIDKTFFGKDFKGDFDNAFIGLRYGIGLINRGDATYSIYDAVWGNSNGTLAGASFIAHWLELTGGFRIELVKRIFVGWNVRAKTMINPKKFAELPPSYIAGYGKGDKNTAFGYNFYVLYGFGKR